MRALKMCDDDENQQYNATCFHFSFSPETLNKLNTLSFPQQSTQLDIRTGIKFYQRQCGESNGTPLQYSCLENPMDGGAWQAAVHGVPKSQTRLNDFTFTFHFHALEKEMATHSIILAWRIPGTGGAWWAAVHGVTQSRTQLKRLGSSSSSSSSDLVN